MINPLLLTKYPKQIFLISTLPSFLLLSRYIIIKLFGGNWREYFHYQIELLIENIPEHKDYLSNFLGKDIPANDIPRVLKNIHAWINLRQKLPEIEKKIASLSQIRTKAEENIKLSDIRPRKSIAIDQSVLICSSVILIIIVATILALVYQVKIQHQEITSYFSLIILLISLVVIGIGAVNNYQKDQYGLSDKIEDIKDQLQKLSLLKQQTVERITHLENF